MRLSYSVLLLATSLIACGAPTNQASVVQNAEYSAAALSVTPSSQAYALVPASSSSQALDVDGLSSANGAQVLQYAYKGAVNQQWRIVQGSASNTFGIINVNSGKALDIANGSATPGVLLEQWDWWNGPMQNWYFNRQSDGTYEIVNLASGLCLDVINGGTASFTPVQQWGCWGGPMQRWSLVAVNTSAASTASTTSAAPNTVTTAPSTTPSATSGTTIGQPTITAMNFQASGNDTFNINDYGATLQTNKQALEAAISATDATENERALVVAMAMLETTYMSIGERDSSKDGTPSANISILNVNADMVIHLGYQGTDNGASLNDPSQLSTVVALLLHGFRTWGVPSTLNYQRGGSTAFADGVSYGAADYRNTVATIYAQIAADPTLLTDSRRIEIYLQHV